MSTSLPRDRDPTALPSNSPLTFIIDICGTLKRLKRQGWVLRQVPQPESDADHMHRVALISLLYHHTNDLDYTNCPEFHPDQIDATKLLRMAVTHDICEALSGDVTPHCAQASQRHVLEETAMQHIARIVGGPLGVELASLWHEYEQQHTPLAKVVKDIDKFEMLVQALEYEQEYLEQCPEGVNPLQDTPRRVDASNSATTIGGHLFPPSVVKEPLRDFFQRQGPMQTPLFQRLDQELRQRRQDMLVSKGWNTTDGEK